MDNKIEWVPFSLTLVQYPKDELFGYIMAFISLTPFWVIVAYFTLSVVNRDLQTILAFIGQLLNEMISLTLKKIIRQPRPIESSALTSLLKSHKQDFGMPSQHSQFLAFFSTMIILSMIFNYKNKNLFSRSLYIFSSLILSGLVIYSRIYLRYHYWYQCAVGAIIGSIFGIIWFIFMNAFLKSKVFLWLESSKIGKILELKNKNVRLEQKNKKFKSK